MTHAQHPPPPLADHLVPIVRGENEFLIDQHDRRYIDLVCGYGAVMLGHGNAAVTQGLLSQLSRGVLCGGIDVPERERAAEYVARFLPQSHKVAGFCSTGMEAAEFAIRIARAITGRTGLIGFGGHMHGKSTVTACLGWDNADGITCPFLTRIAFPPTVSEHETLSMVSDRLRPGDVSAVFIEPLLGSNGGHVPSANFFSALRRMCLECGTLLVFDEILTGFFRTGSAFFFSTLDVTPDIVVVGKAMGNGFPVSAVAVPRDYSITKRMLPGSTFAGNPLACAAVASTLDVMLTMNLPQRVATIEDICAGAFAPLRDRGVALRGRGALWVLELPSADAAALAVRLIRERGVVVGHTARFMRLLPPATIHASDLTRACESVRRVVENVCP